MRKTLLTITSLGVLSVPLLWTPPAAAQASRTFVSGVGNDADPCSRTTPCRTFSGALGKTATGGEINCLDPGGYGTVNITKSITINCEGTLGSILAPSATGVTVNGAGIVVTLRNLAINGVGTGVNGINYLQGAALHMENMVIENFNAAGGTSGFGIRVASSSQGSLVVNNSFILNNGSGATGGGVLIRPAAAVAFSGLLNRVSLERNTNGLVVDTGGGAISINFVMRESAAVKNAFDGISAIAAGGPVGIMVDRSSSLHNGGIGVRTSGAGAAIRIGGSTVAGNATGVSNSGGSITSYKTNQIDANGTDGTPINQVFLN